MVAVSVFDSTLEVLEAESELEVLVALEEEEEDEELEEEELDVVACQQWQGLSFRSIIDRGVHVPRS